LKISRAERQAHVFWDMVRGFYGIGLLVKGGRWDGLGRRRMGGREMGGAVIAIVFVGDVDSLSCLLAVLRRVGCSSDSWILSGIVASAYRSRSHCDRSCLMQVRRPATLHAGCSHPKLVFTWAMGIDEA
jgi:hypothetical protein